MYLLRTLTYETQHDYRHMFIVATLADFRRKRLSMRWSVNPACIPQVNFLMIHDESIFCSLLTHVVVLVI
jgi:hypothetical protein